VLQLGVAGATGVPGQKGAIGYTGLPGQRGPSGATGVTGPRGATGFSGATGFTGRPGISLCSPLYTNSSSNYKKMCIISEVLTTLLNVASYRAVIIRRTVKIFIS